MNKLRVISMLLLLLIVVSNTAGAEIVPRADLYFDSATAFLAADKRVVFDCTTYDVYRQIRITSVWLEQEIDGEWVYAKALTPPSTIAENTISYVAVSSYSGDIGTGTFRVGFTVDADGYAISRYSNSRTF